VMLAPVAWALGSQLSRRWPLAPGFMSAATQMLTAGTVLMVLNAATQEGRPWSAPAKAWAAWGYLCVFGSLVSYSAYTWLLRNTRPAVATSYSYVNPAIAVAVGAVLGNEAVGPSTLVAVCLIVGATVIVVRGKK
jgi:drug/metabolite transporter (DMT)-like permease